MLQIIRWQKIQGITVSGRQLIWFLTDQYTVSFGILIKDRREDGGGPIDFVDIEFLNDGWPMIDPKD